MHEFWRKIQTGARRLQDWRAARFRGAVVGIEDIFETIRAKGRADWPQGFAAGRQFARIILFHTDFYFLIFGMAVLVFTTRAFTMPGVDYGPWRPVVVSLGALFAGAIPLLVGWLLYPLHILAKLRICVIVLLNIGISANIYAFAEPVIPHSFYTAGVLYYKDLIIGMLVFYGLGLGYLHLRLRRFYCFRRYLACQKRRDLYSLLPADLRGAIVSVSAKDHYVNIVTEHGNHTHRMSMKQAVAMLPPDEGVQVHRSHWVSRGAILALEESAGRRFLRLRNGQSIPVSKAKLPEVKAILGTRLKTAV